MGAGLSERTDDCCFAGPFNTSLSPLRDEWRKLQVQAVRSESETEEKVT